MIQDTLIKLLTNNPKLKSHSLSIYRLEFTSDINMSDIEYVKANNDSAVAEAEERWAQLPVVTGRLDCYKDQERRGNVVGMGIKRIFSLPWVCFCGFWQILWQ